MKCCTWPPTLLSFLTPSYGCHTIGAPDFYVVSPVTSNPSCRHERGNSGLSSAGHFSSLSGPKDMPAARITIIPPSAPRWSRWKRTRSMSEYSGMKRRPYQHTLLGVPAQRSLEAHAHNRLTITEARLLKRVQLDVQITKHRGKCILQRWGSENLLMRTASRSVKDGVERYALS